MSRNIRNTIQAVIVDQIVAEGDQSPTAQEMQKLAQLAILKGQRNSEGNITDEWRAFMTFLLTGRGGGAANADDLRRLLPEEDDGPAAVAAERQKDRAYLLGNGMCGTGTGRNILVNGGRTGALDAD